MLTNLPITVGERVAVVPLVSSLSADGVASCLNRGGFWYPQDVFTPLTPAIIGVYDDYGGVKDVENGDLVYEFLVTRYQHELTEAANADGEEFPQTIDDVVTLISRGRVANLALVMFHAGAYRAVVDEVGGRKPCDETFTMREHVERMAENFIDMVNANDLMEAYDSGFGKLLRNRSRYILTKLAATRDTSLLGDLVDLYLMNVALGVGRRAWMPTCGAGGQGADYAVSAVVANFITAKRDEVVNDHLADNDEDVAPEDIARETMFVFSFGVR